MSEGRQYARPAGEHVSLGSTLRGVVFVVPVAVVALIGYLAATNLAAAAKIMADSPITLQLRTLQTIDGLGSSPSNTVILFPAQIGELLQHFTNKPGKE